jgi:hypothetical protein
MIHARSVPTGHIHALLANLTSLHSRRPASLQTQIDEKPITIQISTLTITQLIGHTAWKLYPPSHTPPHRRPVSALSGRWQDAAVGARDPWADLLERLQSLTADGSHHVTQPAERDQPCTECGRPTGYTGRWYSDGVGGLVPYCKACSEIGSPIL